MSIRIAVALFATLVLSNPAVRAQLPQLNSPTAQLTSSGRTPGQTGDAENDAANDLFFAAPGTLEIEFTTTNAEVGILLFMSPVDPTTGAVDSTPWGGTIDIGVPGTPNPGGITILADGIGNTQNSGFDSQFVTENGLVEFDAAIGATWAGARFALQSIFEDPTNPPFNLRNSVAGDFNFEAGQSQVLLTGDDGTANVAFASGTFEFHGGEYSDVWVSGNGFVTFGGPTTLPGGGFGIDTQAWANDRPSIAPVLADWAPDSTSSADGVLYDEIGDEIRIAWGDPSTNSNGGVSHFGDNDMNMFDVVLDVSTTVTGGQFEINLVTLDDTAMNLSGVVGHTPGNPVSGTPGNPQVVSDGVFDRGLQFPTSTGPGEAALEEHAAMPIAGAVGYDGMGTPRATNDVSTFSGQSITFTPATSAGIAGGLGYTSTPRRNPQDRVDCFFFDPNLPLDSDEINVLLGSYGGFTSNGCVTFENPNPADMPLAATVMGVIVDGTASPLDPLAPTVCATAATTPVRTIGGLQIRVPDFGFFAGTLAMTVDFDKTDPASLLVVKQVAVGALNVITTFDDLGDDDSASVNLTNSVSLYGQAYNEMFLGSNGQITFGDGSDDWDSNGDDFSAGFQPAPTTSGDANPGVAVMWSDLNPLGPSGPSSITVTEDTTTGVVRVDYGAQMWADSGESAGDASVEFSPDFGGLICFDLSGLIPAITSTQTVVFGVTDGDDQVGVDNDLSGMPLVLPIVLQSGMGPESWVIEEAATTNPFTLQGLGASGQFKVQFGPFGAIAIF